MHALEFEGTELLINDLPDDLVRSHVCSGFTWLMGGYLSQICVLQLEILIKFITSELSYF